MRRVQSGMDGARAAGSPLREAWGLGVEADDDYGVGPETVTREVPRA